LLFDAEHVDASQRGLLQGFVITGSVGQSERVRLQQAIRHLVTVHHQPLLWVVDDVQWVDETTLQMLSSLSQDLPETLWLLTQRVMPEETAEQVLDWLPEQMVQVLDLPPLTDDEALQLLDSSDRTDVGDSDVSQAPAGGRLARLHAARGRPLYLLCSQGEALGPHFAAHCQARCNTLGADRQVLEAAAHLGLVWCIDDVQALLAPLDVSTALQTAQDLELLQPRGQGEMAFFHPALREFLLDVQTPVRRQENARRAAILLQARGRRAAAAALWEVVGDRVAALDGWHAAATDSVQRDDHHAAVAHFDAVRRLGYAADDASVQQRMSLRLAHARARLVALGYGDALVNEIAQELAHMAEQLNPAVAMDADIRFGAAFLAYLGCSSNGDVDGLAHAQRLVDWAQTPTQHLVAAWAQGNTRLWRGLPSSALVWLERALEMEPLVDWAQRSRLAVNDPINFARVQRLWLQSLRGDDPLLIANLDALARHQVETTSLPQDQCIYHCITAFRCYTEGRVGELGHHAMQALDIAESERYVLWAGVAAVQCALARALQGDIPDLEPLQSRLAAVAKGYAAGIPTIQWLMADLFRATGQMQQALALCDEVLALAEQREHQHCLMDVCRIRAQVLHTVGQTQDAQAAWSQARDLATAAGQNGWLQRWGREPLPWL
jgi:tetratricopeptide (TPR) repeat protein